MANPNGRPRNSDDVVRINRDHLKVTVASKTGLSQTKALAAINAFLEAVTDAVVAGQETQLVGFGTFKVAHRAPRRGVNPQDRSTVIEYPAYEAPVFVPGKQLKDLVRAGNPTVA